MVDFDEATTIRTENDGLQWLNKMGLDFVANNTTQKTEIDYISHSTGKTCDFQYGRNFLMYESLCIDIVSACKRVKNRHGFHELFEEQLGKDVRLFDLLNNNFDIMKFGKLLHKEEQPDLLLYFIYNGGNTKNKPSKIFLVSTKKIAKYVDTNLGRLIRNIHVNSKKDHTSGDRWDSMFISIPFEEIKHLGKVY
jgi:hypothetical protein